MAARSTIPVFTPQVVWMLSANRADVPCTFVVGVTGGDKTGASGDER